MAKVTGVLPERVLEHLRSGAPAVLVTVGADGWGHARLLRERMAATPIIGMWDLSLTEVKDQRWAPMVVSPRVYEWTGPEAEKLRQMEQAVLAEMRDWSEEQ